MARASYPVPLEAVLGTEEAVFDAQLEACWALQSSSILIAVHPQALLLHRWFRHGLDVGVDLWRGINDMRRVDDEQ